jgi:OOP family OmpA-OmpF porin
MSFNLVDSAKSLFTNEILSKASTYLGESEHGVAKAVSGILPAVLGGLVNKASDEHGTQELAQMLQDNKNSNAVENLAGFFGNEGGALFNKGEGFLNSVFNGKKAGLNDLVAKFSGIKSTSVSALMSMAAPAALGLISKHSGSNSLDADAIASLLNSQKAHIAAAMPAGLNLYSLAGIGTEQPAVSAAGYAATDYNYHDEEKPASAVRYGLPLVLLALLAMAAFYFFGKGNNKTTGVVAQEENVQAVKTEENNGTAKDTPAASNGSLDSITGNFIYNTGKMVTIALPNGAGKFEVGEFSTENKLCTFLADAATAVDSVNGNWFEFTNVKFKTGSSEITDGSMTQLKHMVAITKAYPKAQFKLGGYTDNTGSSAANVDLSQKRADAVIAILKKLGAAENAFTGAKGYGPEYPVAANTTPEGRAQNRRVAVNVKAK